jgi:uncharacterized caspase-like protein
VVGIDKYKSNSLNGCNNDAIAVREVLSSNGDGSPNFDVRLELDIAKQSDLLDLIKQLFAREAQIALLYFAGHGTNKDCGYLVTPDCNEVSPGVSMDELLSIVNQSKCSNKVVVLDCCYAGILGEKIANSGTESFLGKGVTIMSACSRDESSVEINNSGVFTNLLVQALKGGAGDVTGRITPASVYSFIDQSLGGWEQRPVFKTNTSQLLPLREIKPKVPKQTLRKLKDYFENASDELKLDPSFEDTNTPTVDHKVIEPYANDINVKKFKELQLLVSIGLVEPVDEDHMYFAAMNSKSCKLTALGLHYWNLSKDSRF